MIPKLFRLILSPGLTDLLISAGPLKFVDLVGLTVCEEFDEWE